MGHNAPVGFATCLPLKRPSEAPQARWRCGNGLGAIRRRSSSVSSGSGISLVMTVPTQYSIT